MPRQLFLCLAFALLTAMPVQAEKNLARPPGTTRYAPLTARLKSLLNWDQTQGWHRMALESIGQSVQGREIWMVTVGGTPSPQGEGFVPHLLYLCRQHGHEPASTEGALAFLDKLVKAVPDSPQALELARVTVSVVPMANPDGSEAFRRHNAHNVDLNRDWIAQSQPETQAWKKAIEKLKPALLTDQHELYPDDRRPDFTETATLGSGANENVIQTCVDAQTIIDGALMAEGTPVAQHWIDDHHPPRLAHRYNCVVAGVPTLLFETNRLAGTKRSVAERAAAHEKFMDGVLRDFAGERPQMLVEAQKYYAAHPRDLRLASRKKASVRGKPPEKTND